MKYEKTSAYDKDLVDACLMGPNAMKLLEELLSMYPLTPGETVFDLGCGMGLTSMFAAREYGVRVFAADLWIAPSDNKQRFDRMGFTSGEIIPLRAEAHNLPFADGFFDTIISIDAYHYFGLDSEYLGKHLLPLVKRGGRILIAVPGMKVDIHDNLPREMTLSWSAEDLETIHDAAHWRKILEATPEAEILSIDEMAGYEECWSDWLACGNPYAVNDRKAMEAGAGKYMNLLAIALRRK
ncbi:MAG: methyltransferase domain-containing protein [Clostridiales bacterium]|nr:methyltransferase domain-containing protein [Clostridiales bacterium]